MKTVTLYRTALPILGNTLLTIPALQA